MRLSVASPCKQVFEFYIQKVARIKGHALISLERLTPSFYMYVHSRIVHTRVTRLWYPPFFLQCCSVIVSLWIFPDLRPTFEGKAKRKPSTTCQRFNVTNCSQDPYITHTAISFPDENCVHRHSAIKSHLQEEGTPTNYKQFC